MTQTSALTETTRLPERALATATALAGILLLVAGAIEPAALDEQHGTDRVKSAHVLTEAAGHRGVLPLFVLTLALGLGCLIPAAIGLTRLTRGRVLAVIGTVLIVVGVPAGIVSNAVSALTLFRLTDSSLPTATAVDVLAGGGGAEGFFLFFPLYLLLFVGVLLIGIALLRARAVPWWQAALVGLGPIIVFLGPTGGIGAAVAALPFCVGLVIVAIRVADRDR